MRKVIATMNMTLDGVCDHTVGIADEELHQHYADMLREADAILYGRITYQLMEFWRTLVTNPSGEKSMDDFAIVMDSIPKVVFSRSLKDIDWESAKLADHDLEKEVVKLKKQQGRDVLVGSRSIIIQLLKLNLIDEFHLCIHPIIAGQGLKLFEDIDSLNVLKLTKTKTFDSGVIALYYEPRSY